MSLRGQSELCDPESSDPARTTLLQTAVPARVMLDVKEAMEEIDALAQEFSFCKTYQSPENLKKFIEDFLHGTSFSVVGNS